MWPFRKTVSLASSGLLQGFTDWHCHLLPGVDDGVRTLDESLHLLDAYERLGIRCVWFTPHIMEDTPNTPAGLKQRFSELQSAYRGNIVLHLAAEHMLDNLFEERLAAHDVLPLGEQGHHLLVETSCFHPPMGLHNILLRIKSRGYHPVLAHPERYLYMEMRDYEALKSMNVKFQLNLFSLSGLYGPEVRKKAERLLQRGMYDLSGTDTHRIEMLDRGVSSKSATSVWSAVPVCEGL